MNNEFVTGIESVNKATIEAVKRLGQIQLRAMERLTEQQIEATSYYLNEGVKQFQALAAAKDLQSAVNTQTQFVSQLNETVVENAKKVAGIMTETRDELGVWVEAGMKAASENPVVKATSKKAA